MKTSGAIFAARDKNPAILENLRGKVQARIVHGRKYCPDAVHIAAMAVRDQPIPTTADPGLLDHDRAIGEQEHEINLTGRVMRQWSPGPHRHGPSRNQ